VDHFFVCGEKRFDHIVGQYRDYYHECRPPQGIGNVLLPTARGEPPSDETDRGTLNVAKIKCERRLGGLLKHYYRAA
jgi:putative transposase